MGNLTEQQKFVFKIAVVLAASLGGWFITLTTWSDGLTPMAFGGLLVILASQLGAILGITPPDAKRAVEIALQPGVHTLDDVEKIKKATSPGIVPTDEVTAAILGKPVQPRIPAGGAK